MIPCVSAAELNHVTILAWREKTTVISGHLRDVLDSCLLMRTEKSSSWGKAVGQKDLRSVLFLLWYRAVLANTFFTGSQIGPLHDPVTWYGINYTGTQVTQWDFQNKGTRTSPALLSFVLKVPLRNLRPSVIYSVPCDRIVQRAYCSRCPAKWTVASRGRLPYEKVGHARQRIWNKSPKESSCYTVIIDASW